MYKIEVRDFGFRLTFGDIISATEMHRWLQESFEALPEQSRPFAVFVDMRTLVPLDPDAQAIMRDGQRLYQQRGMTRSVVILNNPVTTVQFKRIAHESGIYEWERYIDASSTPDWEERGLDWILRAISPDQSRTAAAKPSS
ncbi:MAG: hypothetical protein ABIJ61_12245 [bacterium]